MQNSRLFSRLFSKTITSFSTLKVIRMVIILKDARTSSWRARLNKSWPKPEKNFPHITLIVALKKIFISFSRLFPGLETCAGQISRLFQEFYVRTLYPSVVMTKYGDSSPYLEFWYCTRENDLFSLVLHHCQTCDMQRVCFGLLYSRIPCSLSKCWEWGKSVIFKTVTCISVEFSIQ